MEACFAHMNCHQTICQQSTDNIAVHRFDVGFKLMNATKFEDFFLVIYLLHLVTARCSYDYPIR